MTLILALLLSTAATPSADLVDRALDAMEAAEPRDWAFVETVDFNDTRIVHRHEPDREGADRWVLVSIDGRAPTDDEREKHAKRKAAQETQEDGNNGLRKLIAPGSLVMLDHDASFARYRFKPVTDDEGDARLYEHLTGTLRVVKDGPYIDRVELNSDKPFSPGFSVKVHSFSIVMTFGPEGGDGAVLPRSERFRMAGRAMVVKKIDMDVNVRYGDYTFPKD